MRSILIIIAAILSAGPALSQQQPAATMHDLQLYFADCIKPPPEADGTRFTYYFSLKGDGTVFGRPRIVWLGYGGGPEDRKRLISGFRDAFQQCLPLRLDALMSRTIPGKVYFLQFKVGAQGDAEVTLRPYGSMGDPLVDVPEND